MRRVVCCKFPCNARYFPLFPVQTSQMVHSFTVTKYAISQSEPVSAVLIKSRTWYKYGYYTACVTIAFPRQTSRVSHGAFRVSNTELLARYRIPMKCPLAWISLAFPCPLHRAFLRTFPRAFHDIPLRYLYLCCSYIPAFHISLHFIYPCVSYTLAFHIPLRFIYYLCLSYNPAFHIPLLFIYLCVSYTSAFHIPLRFIYPCISYTSTFPYVSRCIPLYVTPWVVPWLPGGLLVFHGTAPSLRSLIYPLKCFYRAFSHVFPVRPPMGPGWFLANFSVHPRRFLLPYKTW